MQRVFEGDTAGGRNEKRSGEADGTNGDGDVDSQRVQAVRLTAESVYAQFECKAATKRLTCVARATQQAFKVLPWSFLGRGVDTEEP